MSQPQKPPITPPVVNWNPPPKEEIVQTAVEDGITDPQKIAEWAKQRFHLDLSLDEIRKLKQAVEESGKKGA